MSNEQVIKTLEEMTKESFEKAPEQAIEAVNHYLDRHFVEVHPGLAPEALEALKEKIRGRFDKSDKYYTKFKTAITQTSIMVFLAFVKAINPKADIDFEKYTRQFQFYAQQDDKEIYDMRVYYLNQLDSKEMRINESSFTEPVDAQTVVKAQESYDDLITSLKKQYVNSKIHLLA